MTEPKSMADVDISELIKRFESDIQFDAHSFTARFGRSHARQELERRGRAVLRPIAEHLREHLPEPGSDLRVAWGYLLSRHRPREERPATVPRH